MHIRWGRGVQRERGDPRHTRLFIRDIPCPALGTVPGQRVRAAVCGSLGEPPADVGEATQGGTGYLILELAELLLKVRLGLGAKLVCLDLDHLLADKEDGEVVLVQNPVKAGEGGGRDRRVWWSCWPDSGDRVWGLTPYGPQERRSVGKCPDKRTWTCPVSLGERCTAVNK